jgi:hypothetical protein
VACNLQELAQVTRLLHRLPSDADMDGDALTFNVLEDAIADCRNAPNVMLLAKAINQHDQRETLLGCVFVRGRAERVRDRLAMDAAGEQHRNSGFYLAVAHERITSRKKGCSHCSLSTTSSTPSISACCLRSLNFQSVVPPPYLLAS